MEDALIDHRRAGCVRWNGGADPRKLNRLFVGRERQVPIAATPVDTNGDGAFSTITTRYVEAAVRYRLR